MNPSIQATAMQNALSGEKTLRTVTYPQTGDPQGNVITGFLALKDFEKLNCEETIVVLRYLLDRAQADLKKQEEMNRPWRSVTAGAVPGTACDPGMAPPEIGYPVMDHALHAKYKGKTLMEVFQEEERTKLMREKKPWPGKVK